MVLHCNVALLRLHQWLIASIQASSLFLDATNKLFCLNINLDPNPNPNASPHHHSSSWYNKKAL